MSSPKISDLAQFCSGGTTGRAAGGAVRETGRSYVGRRGPGDVRGQEGDDGRQQV